MRRHGSGGEGLVNDNPTTRTEKWANKHHLQFRVIRRTIEEYVRYGNWLWKLEKGTGQRRMHGGAFFPQADTNLEGLSGCQPRAPSNSCLKVSSTSLFPLGLSLCQKVVQGKSDKSNWVVLLIRKNCYDYTTLLLEFIRCFYVDHSLNLKLKELCVHKNINVIITFTFICTDKT